MGIRDFHETCEQDCHNFGNSAVTLLLVAVPIFLRHKPNPFHHRHPPPPTSNSPPTHTTKLKRTQQDQHQPNRAPTPSDHQQRAHNLTPASIPTKPFDPGWPWQCSRSCWQRNATSLATHGSCNDDVIITPYDHLVLFSATNFHSKKRGSSSLATSNCGVSMCGVMINGSRHNLSKFLSINNYFQKNCFPLSWFT